MTSKHTSCGFFTGKNKLPIKKMCVSFYLSRKKKAVVFYGKEYVF